MKTGTPVLMLVVTADCREERWGPLSGAALLLTSVALVLVVVCWPALVRAAEQSDPHRGPADSLHLDSSYLAPSFVEGLEVRAEYLVAVLPVENHTVDPEAPYFFRRELVERLIAKGFTVRDPAAVDGLLHELGVSHAGQLGLLPFSELASRLAVDGVMSAVVEQSAVQRAGLYNAYVFTVSVKLQDGSSGQVLWTALTERAAKRRFALDPINMIIDTALVGQGRSAEAMAYLAQTAFDSLPDGPVEVHFADPLLDRAVMVEVAEPASGGRD